MDTRILGFVGLATLVTVTPGADMAVVARVALSGGAQAALRTSAGVLTGLTVWATLSAIGLAALLTASATAFTVLKLVGAAYLCWLGAQALWATRRGSSTPLAGHDGLPARRRSGSTYRMGLFSNLLNPKVGVFYTTFLPQFITPGAPVLATTLLLAGIHLLISVLWLVAYVRLVTRAGDVLRRPSVKRALDRVTGAVLIAFGLRLAVEHR